MSRQVEFVSDNMSVVAVLSSGMSRFPGGYSIPSCPIIAGRARGWVASRAGCWVFWLFGIRVSSSSSQCSWAPNLHNHATMALQWS